MSGTFLTTYSILISEVAIILIAAVVFLFLRLRKQRTLIHRKRKVTNTIQDIILPYLETLITATKSRLDHKDSIKDEIHHVALLKRLEFLESQRNLLNNSGGKFDKEAYWELVENEYIETNYEQKSSELTSNKEQVYQSRIDNLENFKQLFFEAEEKLRESFKTIEELRTLINEVPTLEVNKLLSKVNQLKEDKEALEEKLKKASGRLKESLTALKIVQDNDTHDDLDAVKEENEFLLMQIQHLLKQEVESTKKMVDNISTLENALHEKETECARLTAKVNKLSQDA